MVGKCVSANADSVEQLALGRLLVGIGVGAASGFVALYISEVSHMWRGMVYTGWLYQVEGDHCAYIMIGLWLNQLSAQQSSLIAACRTEFRQSSNMHFFAGAHLDQMTCF